MHSYYNFTQRSRCPGHAVQVTLSSSRSKSIAMHMICFLTQQGFHPVFSIAGKILLCSKTNLLIILYSLRGDMISYLRIVGNMMKKVGKYLGGGNKDKVKLNMTAPLLHKYVRPAKGAKATIHLYFYVPSEYQDSVPAPSDSSLSVVGIEMCVYSHRFRFPAFVAEPQQYIHHVRMLKRFLKRDGLDGTYEDGFFYAATYDRLIKMRNRRNEVWLQKKM